MTYKHGVTPVGGERRLNERTSCFSTSRWTGLWACAVSILSHIAAIAPFLTVVSCQLITNSDQRALWMGRESQKKPTWSICTGAGIKRLNRQGIHIKSILHVLQGKHAFLQYMMRGGIIDRHDTWWKPLGMHWWTLCNFNGLAPNSFSGCTAQVVD